MTQLIEKTNNFVSQLLQNKLPKEFTYHNHVHTQRVFKSTKEIIDNSNFSKEEILVLELAALLHDVGYTKTRGGHEEASALIAIDFLSTEGVERSIVDQVAQTIRATKLGVVPTNELEKTLCDADASHFAKRYFEEASEYLRQELKLLGIIDHSLSSWRTCNIQMFRAHHQYYTDYAIKNWKPKKDNHLVTMLNEQKKYKKAKKKEKLKAKLKDESPEKGVQSMFRITLRNHIKLSDIADTKANILLSVNAIIISVALSNLIPKLDKNEFLIVPTLIFMIFSIVSMILSVLATRPNVTSGKFTKQDVQDKKVNLLFFGNFHKMSLDQFEWAINEMMKDKGYIYSALTKDLYFLGVVLDRKYRILRITYTVFIIGIVVSAIAFAVFFKMQEGEIVASTLTETIFPILS